MKVVFTQCNDAPPFTAMRAAETWCENQGISYAPSCGNNPRGLMAGDYEIAKWRNLTPRERKQLHGTMTGPLRTGPIVVVIDEQILDAHQKESAT